MDPQQEGAGEELDEFLKEGAPRLEGRGAPPIARALRRVLRRLSVRAGPRPRPRPRPQP
jgi:hypothetical protein